MTRLHYSWHGISDGLLRCSDDLLEIRKIRKVSTAAAKVAKIRGIFVDDLEHEGYSDEIVHRMFCEMQAGKCQDYLIRTFIKRFVKGAW